MHVYVEMCGDGLCRLNVVPCGRNGGRLGNGVLYASVNPEYFSAADGKPQLAVWAGAGALGSGAESGHGGRVTWR